MNTRKVKDAYDLNSNEKIYFRGHAKSTYMSNGKDVETTLNSKQDELISGFNIKTINEQSILGDGNINIMGGSSNLMLDFRLMGDPDSVDDEFGKLIFGKDKVIAGLKDISINDALSAMIGGEELVLVLALTVSGDDITYIRPSSQRYEYEGNKSVAEYSIDMYPYGLTKYILTLTSEGCEIIIMEQSQGSGGGDSYETPDWNASEDEAGYIKNKPFYQNDKSNGLQSFEITDTEQYINVREEYSEVSHMNIYLDSNKEYLLTSIDMSYIKDYDTFEEYNNSIQYNDNIINIHVFFTDPYYDSLAVGLSTVMTSDSGEEYINIYYELVNKNIKTLDEKYIPETIARKKDLEDITANVEIDNELSDISENPVQNKVVSSNFKNVLRGKVVDITPIGSIPQNFIQGTPSGDPMHYMFELAGASYNNTDYDAVKIGVYGDEYIHKSKHWCLNELGNITNEEMREMYEYGLKLTNPTNVYNAYFRGRTQRTFVNYARYTGTIRTGFAYYMCANVENILLGNEVTNTDDCTSMFAYCIKLRKIIGTLNVSKYTSDSNNIVKRLFGQCESLEYFQLQDLKVPIELPSKHISAKSIFYMIANSSATESIGVYLHPESLERARDMYLIDTEYNTGTYSTLDEWASSKNIQLNELES